MCRRGLVDATGPDRDVLTRYLSSALADLGDLGGALSMVDQETRGQWLERRAAHDQGSAAPVA